MAYDPLPADLIFTRSPKLLGKCIRWFERAGHEPPTWTNHVAGVGPTGTTVIEAKWHVDEINLDRWMDITPVFQVWRNTKIPNVTRQLVATKARTYVGRHYGWWKLFPHLTDGLASKIVGRNVYFARRMLFMDRYPICSWVWSYTYAHGGIRFGCPPDCADPDTMHDYVRDSWEWKKAWEKGPSTNGRISDFEEIRPHI